MKLDIKNFQSHKQTCLEFVDGVNVITGISGSGKSAIVRALNWAANNRPQGFGFKGDFSEEKDTTEVILEFDQDVKVIRKRDNKFNGYSIPDDPKLEAVRSDVPTEVSTLLNLADHNIQQQHDNYFLLQDTSGEVAKKFNRVVGLDIIDVLLKGINSIVLSSNREVTRLEADIKEKGQELDKFAILDEIEDIVKGLEDSLIGREKRRQQRRGLLNLLREIEELGEDIEEVDIWLEVEKEAGDIFKSAKEMSKNINERDMLKTLLESIDNIDGQIAELNIEIQSEMEVQELRDSVKQHKQDIKTMEELKDLIFEIEELSPLIEEHESELGQLEKDKQRIFDEAGMCPLCRRPF